jgi:hypothetical protein
MRDIVEEYQKGDAEKRLNLFMECPSLRDEFVQMEQEEAKPQSEGVLRPFFNQDRKRKRVFSPCTRMLKWCNLN